MRVEAVSRARRGAPLGPLVAERALASTSAGFEVPPRHRYAGSGEDHRLTRGPVRGVSRAPAPVLARLPNPGLAGRPKARLADRHPPSFVCAGAHLYSALQHIASDETPLGPGSGYLRPDGCRAMRDLGFGLRRMILPRTPVNRGGYARTSSCGRVKVPPLGRGRVPLPKVDCSSKPARIQKESAICEHFRQAPRS
jgi:hypothetical protein